MIADATQGGIPLETAEMMPRSKRTATWEILKRIREQQRGDDMEKAR